MSAAHKEEAVEAEVVLEVGAVVAEEEEAHFSSAAPGAEVIAQETAPRSGIGSLDLMIIPPIRLNLLIRLIIIIRP